MNSGVLGAVGLLGAAVLLTAGAELFVENIAGAARRMGLTVLAVAILLAGAEPEEALTGVIASAQGKPGLAAGDAIGANITMLTAALGLAALIRPLPIGRRVRQYAVGAALTGLVAHLTFANDVVSRVEGIGLVSLYIALVAVVWWREREAPTIGELAEIDDDDDDDDDDDAAGGRAPGVALLLALLGLVVMTAGGALAVDGATRVVGSFGVSERAVGLTALALATTAELFALLVAAFRRNIPEVAVAGVVGSAAYNATMSLGLAAAVAPLPVTDMRGPSFVAAILPLVVLVLSPRKVLGRIAGAVLALLYVGYLVLVLAA